MRIVRFADRDNVKYGVLEGETISGIQGNPFEQFTSRGYSFKRDEITYKLNDVKLLAPCAPSKIVCVEINPEAGINEESRNTTTEKIVINLQPSTAVIGPNDNVMMPEPHNNISLEGELGIVMGKTARDVPEEKAKEYVIGYTCHGDIANREVLIVEPNGYPRAKSFDTFAPIGPWIVTDIDPDNIDIQTHINSKVVQLYNTGKLVFKSSKLISFVSGVMTLLPGDIISTGAPNFIGPISPGSVVEITIENIGTLRNKINCNKLSK